MFTNIILIIDKWKEKKMIKKCIALHKRCRNFENKTVVVINSSFISNKDHISYFKRSLYGQSSYRPYSPRAPL